jgi:hypothetical protein
MKLTEAEKEQIRVALSQRIEWLKELISDVADEVEIQEVYKARLEACQTAFKKMA